MADTACTQELWHAVLEDNPSHFKGIKLPVENVNWKDCLEFAEKLNKLQPILNSWLPTEAEWEYACRAGTTTPFSTGENLTTDQANYNGKYPYKNYPKGKYIEKTTPVGSYPPNAWGLYDMHGNVWEWCIDWYDKEYYNKCQKEGIIENPQGPDKGSYHVLRGGRWGSFAQCCRSSFRDSRNPDSHGSSISFRIVFVHQCVSN